MAENSNKREGNTNINGSKHALFSDNENKPKNSIKAITSQLNLVDTPKSHIIIRSKYTERFVETFCCHFVKSSLDTIYIPLLCLTIIPLLCSSLFIILWFYSNGLAQQTDYIHLTIESMAERTRHSIIDEFWIPQMLISMTIGALFNGDLDINAATMNGEYDDIMISFSNIPHTESIFSLGMYNSNSNTLLIGYRANNNMNIWNFNGTCSKNYTYGASIGYINNLTVSCDYDVSSRDWYTLGMNNLNKAIWTEPYSFIGGYSGMSLVAAFEYDDTILIFICEIIVDIFKTALTKNILMPEGSVIMIATPKLDIIASTNDQTDPMIVSTVEYLKQQNVNGKLQLQEQSVSYFDPNNGYSMSIFPFEMVYVNFIPIIDMDNNGSINDIHLIKPLLLNNSNDYQYGYIIITNDDTYLFNIDLALIISWIVLPLVLIAAITLICINMKYHDDQIVRKELQENQARVKWLSTRRLSGQFTPGSKVINTKQAIELATVAEWAQTMNNTFPNTDTKSKIKTVKLKRKKLQKGDRVATKDGKTGTVQYITKLLEDSAFSLIGLELDNGKTVFTNLNNIILSELYPMTNTMNENLNQIQEEDINNMDDVKDNKQSNYKKLKIDSKSPDASLSVMNTYDNSEQKRCCYLSQQKLIFASFCHIMCLCLILIGLWSALLNSAKSNLIQNIMAKQEWGSAKDEVMELYEKSEMVLAIYKDRYERGDFKMD
eukprot:393478_1